MSTALPVLDRLSTLADSMRSRLLFVLDQHEVTVGELCSVVQLPQSTVSRHLKALGDDGWVVTRAEGTSRYYRRNPALDERAERLWDLLKEDIAQTAAAQEDRQRTASVLAARRTKSREFFTTAATRWDALRRELYGDAQEMALLPALLDPKWVAGDLGCGTGQLSALLAPHVSRVIGVDGSDAMLAAARARMPDVPNVDLRLGDLEALPIDAATLDLGVLSLVLHYVAEPPRALAEAFRVLATGGRLVILDMQPHAREEYRQQMGHIWQGFDEAQMRDWLSNAGFSAIRVHALPVDETSRGPALFVASGTKI